MTTEGIAAKAARLLGEGGVLIRWVSPGAVCATVQGDTGVYEVHLHSGRWWCTCPAWHGCSHLGAVELVTVPKLPADLPEVRQPAEQVPA
jgi:hypothetical protein